MGRWNGIRALAVGLLVVLAAAGPASAQSLDPAFADDYTLNDIGSPPGIPASLGGLTFKPGTTDRLLIGGNANTGSGALYEIGVVRDAEHHIPGFSGKATRYSAAAYNDGGVITGPGGVLLLARWPSNELGETKPGSA